MKTDLKDIFGRYGFYLWPVLVVLTMMFIFVNVDWPEIEKINSTRQELSGIKERLLNLTQKSNLLASLNKEQLTQNLEKINNVLPDDKDAPSILRTIENAASTSGVTVTTLDLAPGKLATIEATQVNKNEIPFKLIVDGSLSQISQFLATMTTTGRAVEVSNLDITPTEGSSSAKANLEMVAFFLPAVESVGSSRTTISINIPLAQWNTEEKDALTKIYQREIFVVSPNASAGKTDIFK